jgi:anti-sigma-K factor RskA
MQDSQSPSSPSGVSSLWRLATAVLAIVLLVAWATAASMYEQFKAQIAHLETRLHQVPQIQNVSVLLDAQGQAQLLTTFNPQNKTLQVQRLTDVRETSEQSLHLWALSKNDAPLLLGVLTSRYPTTQLEVDPKALQGASELAISVESKDKGPIQGLPRQPLAFKGWWVQKAI